MALYLNGEVIEISSDGNISNEFTRISENLFVEGMVKRPTSTNITDATMNTVVEVEGHKAICSNIGIKSAQFYDSSMNIISNVTGKTGYQGRTYPILIPNGAKYAKCTFWSAGGNTHNQYPNTVGDDNEITLYTSDSEYPQTDRRTEVLPHKMLDAGMIYGTLNHALPSEEMVRMIRCQSVRILNESRHAFRFGNFNTYVNRGTGNWDRIGEMLADYGVDVCGFEEMQYKENTSSNVADVHLGHHLISKRPWQFTSTNETVPDGSTDSPFSSRGMVSRFPIVESEELPWTDIGQGNYNNHSAMYAKIKIPKYLDATGGEQYLGFYTIHPTVTGTREMQAHEMQTCIDHMETTGNAFNIISADSNAFYIDSETGEQSLMKWMKEQGFKLVHDSISKTTTEASPDHGGAIDQLFVSQNIDVLNYDIINSWEYSLLDQYGNEVPISDHDFIYADLRFNYDEIVNRCRPMTDVALINNLTHVTTDYPNNYHVQFTDNLVIHLAPETGYTMKSVTVKIKGSDVTSTRYANGVVTIPSSAITGDIYITAIAE